MSKLAALALTTLTITTACKKDESATGADSKKAMGLYAQGYNALIEDPSRALDGYFSSIPSIEKLDLARRPHLSDATFATRKLDEARKAFAAAKDAAPSSLKLGPVADAAIASTEKALALYGSALAYYQAENYKDDKGAKAKELHAQLVEARKSFHTALGNLGEGMESIEDAQAADEIAKYAGDKSYSYWFRFYTHAAKRHVVLPMSRASSMEDLVKVAAAIKAFAPNDLELAQFVHKKGPKLSSSFKNYADNATSFQAEAKKLVRLIEDGKTFDDAELGRATDSVISAFNALNQVGNALYQVEAVDNLKDS